MKKKKFWLKTTGKSLMFGFSNSEGLARFSIKSAGPKKVGFRFKIHNLSNGKSSKVLEITLYNFCLYINPSSDTH